MNYRKFIKTRKKELITLFVILLLSSSYVIILNFAEIEEQKRISELKLPITKKISFEEYTLGGLVYVNNSIWAISPSKKALIGFNESGDVLAYFSLNLSAPWGISYKDGLFYIVDSLTSNIYTFNISSSKSSFVMSTNLTLLKGISWVNGELFVVDISRSTVYKVNITSKTVTAFSTDVQLEAPTGIAWNGTSLWLADMSHTRIYNINITTGKLIKEYYSPGGSPAGITWGNQSLWIYDASQRILYKTDPFAPRVVTITLTVPAWFYVVLIIAVLPLIFSILHKQELYLDEFEE
ncbi:MAG: hypothetical protein ACP6IU_09480 [Candidatus Asgardarchaeia archaeon]